MNLLAIIWDFKPEIFPNIDLPILGNLRWYGILWALSFLAAHFIVEKMYKREGKNLLELDGILLYTLIGCVLGARLGHCFFYEPETYLADPIQVLKVWEGGLASHGAGIGLIIACYFIYRKFKTQSFLAVLDKVAITVALAGCLIRLGNFLNSEIIGTPSDSATAIVFANDIQSNLSYERVLGKSFQSIDYQENNTDTTVNGVTFKGYNAIIKFDPAVPTVISKGDAINYLPSEHVILGDKNAIVTSSQITKDVFLISRHPSQLYESFSCLLLFGFLLWIYYHKYKVDVNDGLIFGLFLIICFGLRFMYEFYKEDQVAHEASWTLNTGQRLSIPLVLIGIYCLVRSFSSKKDKKTE
jgi:phosphatidylglycerol---prolipoprotein diacylglyceryl transferase